MTVESIQSALNDGLLDGNVAELARQCLDKLGNPLRVTILGAAVTEASALANFLIGQPILQANSERSLVRMVHHGSERARVICRDNTQKTFRGMEVSQAFDSDPKMVEIGMDLPALGKMTVVRAASPSMRELRGAIKWIASSTDVVLWCTSLFGESEKALWGALPERLRDRGYLITKPGAITPEMRASESEFQGIIEIDARVASAARSSPKGLNKSAFRAAGGNVMIKALKREIELSERAASDAAYVILKRHVEPALKNRPARPKTEKPVFVDDVAPPVHKDNVTALDRPLILRDEPAEVRRERASRPRPVSNPVREELTTSAISTMFAPTKEDEQPTKLPERPNSKRIRPISRTRSRPVSRRPSVEVKPQLVETAPASDPVAALFEKVGNDIGADAAKLVANPEGDVIAALEETVMNQLDQLMNSSLSEKPGVTRLVELLEECSEVLTLMKIENDDTAKLDAVCLLIQVRREMFGFLTA